MWFFWQFVCFRPKKRVASKTKVAKISLFVCFFLKNDQILTNTKIFKICIFFFIETHKQVHNILLNTFQIRILFWYFYSTCGKTIIFWEKLKFFLNWFTVVFDKNNFFIFLLFWKNLSFYEKETFWPLLSSLSYLKILLQK